MGKPFLSRHFLAEQASSVAAIPFAAAGAADEQGVATTHNLLALGSWSEDAKGPLLSVIDLAVSHSGDEVLQPPAMARLASFQHPGLVSAVEVADMGGGAVLLLTGSAGGGVCRLRMQMPTQPGSEPAEIQLREEDFDGPDLLPWLDVHPGGVAALAANAEKRELLTAGSDGSLMLTPLGGDGGGDSSTALYRSEGAAAFAAARWNGASTAVTGCQQGLLHTWDTRQPGGPTLQLQQPAARPSGSNGLGLPAAAPSITCLDVHPAQPFCCATGGSDGGVALWDLRSPGRQAQQGAVPAHVACCFVGDRGTDNGGSPAVCKLGFEGSSSIGSGSQRLVYCTAGGAIGVLRDVAAAAACPQLLFREPTAAVRACCLGIAGPCTQLFCATDQEGLVYLANAL